MSRESRHKLRNASNLSNHVLYALLHHLVRKLSQHIIQSLIKIGSSLNFVSDLTQVRFTQQAGSFLAGGTALLVLAVVKLVGGTGVDDEKLCVHSGEIARLAGCRLHGRQAGAEVEQERVIFAAAHGSRLVQAAGGSARHLVFRGDSSSDQSQAAFIRATKAQLVHVVECQSRRAGHGCRAGKPGAQRHTGDEGSVEALHSVEARLLQCPGNTDWVSSPALHTASLQPVEARLLHIAGVELGDHANKIILARRQSNECAVRQGNRQAQAGVVIRVLADEVDAPWCAPHALWLLAESVGEKLGCLHCCFFANGRLNECNAHSKPLRIL